MPARRSPRDRDVTPADPEAGRSLPSLIPVSARPRRRWVRLGMIAFALLLILMGIAVSPLPIPAGFLFWIAGLLVLGASVPTIGRWLNRQEERLPLRWRKRLRPKFLMALRRKLKRLR